MSSELSEITTILSEVAREHEEPQGVRSQCHEAAELLGKVAGLDKRTKLVANILYAIQGLNQSLMQDIASAERYGQQAATTAMHANDTLAWLAGPDTLEGSSSASKFDAIMLASEATVKATEKIPVASRELGAHATQLLLELSQNVLNTTVQIAQLGEAALKTADTGREQSHAVIHGARDYVAEQGAA